MLLLVLGAAGGCRSLTGPSGPDGVPPRERGDALYTAGEYGPAAHAYRRHLDDHPRGRGNDQVLFRLAAIHLLPDSPVHDPAAAVGLLERLIRSHPDSPLAEPARVLRSLQVRVEGLEEQSEQQEKRLTELAERLEALKRIDLERSREPPLR